MTTKEDIRGWFERGVEQKAKYMFVVCDTFDWQDFPSFAYSVEDACEKLNKYSSGVNMTKLMEVYDLSKDMEKQLKSDRCFAEII